MEPEGLLPCSPESAISPYPEPDKSTFSPSFLRRMQSTPFHPVSIISIVILSYHLCRIMLQKWLHSILH